MKAQYFQPQTIVVLACPDLMKVPSGGGSGLPPSPNAPAPARNGEGSSVKLTKMYI